MNLVPNGSFEGYSSCPVSNDFGNGQLELAVGWWKPTLGTSDYFNRCHTNGIVDVPDNFWGHQEPYHGDGYVGLGPYGWFINSGEVTAYEYVQTKLKEPLAPCVEYRFSMYVSLAEKAHYAFGKIGALFTVDSIGIPSAEGIIAEPTIRNLTGPITDTVNWIRVSGNFIATGNEQYLTLGYFEDEITNDTIFLNPSSNDYAGYYYIDSVSVIEVGKVENCEPSLPNVFTPNNDGVNDYYDLSLLGAYKEVTFVILNRWGNIVFEFDQNNMLWDGANKGGSQCSEGIYFYMLKTKTINKTGFIQLVRD